MHSVAAIDVGSSATRLSTVSVSPTGVVEGRSFRRFGLRLGTDVFADGRITSPRIEVLTDAFLEIAHLLKTKGIVRHRAIGTAALRDAANGDEVVAQIRERTGVHVEIVSGEEESRLARRALLRALGSVRPATLLVDLGGGSLEIEWARGRVVRSLPFGTVRLLQSHPAFSGPMDARCMASLLDVIRNGLRPHVRRAGRATTAVATGGNLVALAQILPCQDIALPAVDLDRLPELAEQVAALTLEERVAALGIRPDRADVILPAMLIFVALRDLLGLTALVVPGTGIRESILHELVRPPRVRNAIRHLSATLGDALPSAQRTAAAARALFTALAPIHGLWPPAAAALETAAYLQHVDDAAALRGPNQLVSHLENVPVDGRIREVAAAAAAEARGCRGAAADLPAGDAVSAQVLGALLCLASAISKAAAPVPKVDLTRAPVAIDARLPAPLDPVHVLALERALGRPVSVR